MLERRGLLLSLVASACLPQVLRASPPGPFPPFQAIADLQQQLEALVSDVFQGCPLYVQGMEIGIGDLLAADFFLPAFLTACADAEPGCVMYLSEQDGSAFMSRRVTGARVVDWDMLRTAASKVAMHTDVLPGSALDIGCPGGPLDRSWESIMGVSMHADDVDIKLAFHPDIPAYPAAQARVTPPTVQERATIAARYAKVAAALWEPASAMLPQCRLSLADAAAESVALPASDHQTEPAEVLPLADGRLADAVMPSFDIMASAAADLVERTPAIPS